MRLYIPVYTITLFLSAFLLFLIQPLFSKMILPLLGGSPAVWNTAMVFFQAMLLAGYAYAHFIARFLDPRFQALTHLALLLLFTVVLPVAVPEGWEPPATSNPAWWQLSLMTVAVGGPFFVLAGTAPLLQHWFVHTDHPEAGNPYFLYAASNFGSMSALIAYPVIVEPLTSLQQQSALWAFGYGSLTALIIVSAWLIRKWWRQPILGRETGPVANDNGMNILRIGQWLILAFAPSSLMLGVTMFITTDLASMPLLWVIPLALYVGTFIIAFARFSPIKLKTVLILQGLLLCTIIGLFVSGIDINKFLLVGIHLALFFFTALFCHMQLAALRPDVRHLTAFYLVMSAGGVLGGVFNALVAPHLFVVPYEYALVMALAAFLRHQTDPRQTWKKFLGELKRAQAKPGVTIDAIFIPLFLIGTAIAVFLMDLNNVKLAGGIAIGATLIVLLQNRWPFALTVAAILLIYPGTHWKYESETLLWKRNFFGILRVADLPYGNIRLFSHGTTIHGTQPLDDAYRMIPISYYHMATGAGDVFHVLNALPGPQRIAVLGLGTGSVACYARPDRHFDFFEIDPDVVEIAENKNLFTYLSDCGSPYDVILGDARLQMAKQENGKYDLIFIDIYSSDNIPIHTMTREAFAVYLHKLKPNGIITINTSNRYLKLEPVVAAIAQDLGLHVLFKRTGSGTIPDTAIPYSGAHYGVLARRREILAPFHSQEGWEQVQPAKRAWSDDFSNLIGAILSD